MPAKKPPKRDNLAAAIRRIKKDPTALTDECLKQLALSLILDQPDDKRDKAEHGKLKLDALNFIFKVNRTSAPQGADDFSSWKEELSR